MSETNNMKVTIDGITVEVPAGTTILQAARKIGGSVAPPTMCYYSSLEGSGGKCRSCLVEVSKGSEKDPRPMPKLVASCRTSIMDGMEVKSMSSERAVDARKSVAEFLLINHPIDCPVCDQAGECTLQDLSYQHGFSASRYEFVKRTFPPEDIGPYIQLHMNRCIHCYRCLMVADQLTDQREHGFMERGDHMYISTYLSKALTNEFIGNVIDVCPVGALTDKTFRFKNRVWFTKPLDAHRACTTPGCCGEVRLWMRGKEVFRVTARRDEWDEVAVASNGKTGWICNECRFEKKQTSDWIIDGPTNVNRNSVIAQGHYAGNVGMTKPKPVLDEVIGKEAIYKLDIYKVSEVNKKEYHLDQIKGPAHSTDFDKNKSLGNAKDE